MKYAPSVFYLKCSHSYVCQIKLIFQEQSWQITALRLNPGYQLFLSIKFYWNTAVFILLCILYSCLCSISMAELSNDYRDCIAYKDLVIHYVDLYEKSLHISISVDFSGKDKYIKNYLSFAMFKLFFFFNFDI